VMLCLRRRSESVGSAARATNASELLLPLPEQCLKLSPSLIRRGGLRRFTLHAATKQSIELRLRLSSSTHITDRIGPRPRLEVIAKIRPLFAFYFLRHRLPTMLGHADAVPLAQLANMQLGMTLLALVETTQRKAQVRERSSAFPTDKRHGRIIDARTWSASRRCRWRFRRSLCRRIRSGRCRGRTGRRAWRSCPSCWS